MTATVAPIKTEIRNPKHLANKVVQTYRLAMTMVSLMEFTAIEPDDIMIDAGVQRDDVREEVASSTVGPRNAVYDADDIKEDTWVAVRALVREITGR